MSSFQCLLLSDYGRKLMLLNTMLFLRVCFYTFSLTSNMLVVLPYFPTKWSFNILFLDFLLKNFRFQKKLPKDLIFLVGHTNSHFLDGCIAWNTNSYFPDGCSKLPKAKAWSDWRACRETPSGTENPRVDKAGTQQVRIDWIMCWRDCHQMTENISRSDFYSQTAGRVQRWGAEVARVERESVEEQRNESKPVDRAGRCGAEQL